MCKWLASYGKYTASCVNLLSEGRASELLMQHTPEHLINVAIKAVT